MMEIEEPATITTESKTMMKEDLSRQEGAYGAKMIGKLKKMKCAVFGLRGAGIEIAKNLMLAGPHTVMVHDDEKVEIADLGTNFYLSEADVKSGKTRAQACEKKLSEINPFTYFRTHVGPITSESVNDMDVVIFADSTPLVKLVEINDYCHKKGKKFIYVSLYGMMMSIFSDFGPDHEIYDSNGDAERSFVIDKLETVPQPFANMGEFLKSYGVSEEKLKKMGYRDKKLACFDVLKTEAQLEVDEKRKKSMSANELLVLLDKKFGHGRKMCGKITTIHRHLLSDGDFVRLDEIVMSESQSGETKKIYKLTDKIGNINTTCEIKTHRSNPNVLYIGDISGLGTYKGGGIGTQVKMPKKTSYKSLKEELSNPTFEIAFADMIHFGDERKAHVAWMAVQKFLSESKRLPYLLDEKDAMRCVAIAKELEIAKSLGSFDEEFVTKAALFARAETNAFASIAGGVVAQEAMKQTGKYTPISQWIHFHSLQMLDRKAAGKPQGTRYDHYITLFGEKFMEDALKAKFFLVGCGALGCEFLKNIAVTGLGCSSKGEVHITDDDVIELSNLSRQFLFRRRHIGKLKSKSAAGAAIEMNPALKEGLKLHNTRVEPKTENEFSDKFWENLDFVVNALDNLKARHYVDTKCIIFGKPLFESGTLGTQANQTIHVPKKTPSYQEGAPPGENQGIAMCTMTNFPYEPLHCIEWSRMMFGQVFEDGPSAYEDLRKSGVQKYLEKTGKNISEEFDVLKKTLKWVHIAANPTIDQCVKLSFDHFIGFYRDDVKNLIHSFPEDARVVDKATKKDKGAFWHGRRRFPRPHDFSLKNEDHVEFLYRTTCIYASIFAVAEPTCEKVVEMVSKLAIPKWEPKKDTDVEVDEDGKKATQSKAVSSDEYEEIEKMRAEVKTIDTSKLVQIFPAEFEKDDDTNHHVDWITSSSNLRGWTRKLKPSSRAHCRMTAGRIIAAVATATAAITGLVFLEIYKLLKNTGDVNDFRWSTINLATNVFAIELPADPVTLRNREEKYTVEEDGEIKNMVRKITCIPKEFTIYDFIEMKEGKDVNLTSFIDAFPKNYHGLKITMLTAHGKDKKAVMYQEINEAFYKMEKSNAERLVKMIRNKMQKQRAQTRVDSAVKMLEKAEEQKKFTVLQAYKNAYGELTDTNREFVILSALVEPTDRELGDNERIDIPPIKYYFK
ncbi:hypothetical protein AAMO2058_000827900 [Amorphochlora amoebiformis]